MDLKVEPKEVLDAYSTPIVQQTAFWSRVKERLGMHSCAFEYSVRNSDLYDGVGGFARTNADFIMFYQYLNAEDYVAYVPYGPEIEPPEDRQGEGQKQTQRQERQREAQQTQEKHRERKKIE